MDKKVYHLASAELLMKAIGYLGIPGSYSHTAATQFFADADYSFVGYESFRDIFEGIRNKEIASGAIPIENTLAGSIYENYDLLDAFDIPVIGEYYLKISHSLLAQKKFASKDLKTSDYIIKVYSHPKALEQCSDFLRKRPWMKPQSFSDTANAAKFISEQHDPNLASIGSQEAAKLYDLKVVAKNIENNPENYTRFLVIGKTECPPTGKDKTSLVISLPNKTGSLFSVLQKFNEHSLNLLKIESRPLKKNRWEYNFFIDFVGHKQDLKIKQILDEIKVHCIGFDVLGSYPLADENQ